MQDLRVIFMGTPVFSVPILTELINNTKVVMVVTAPDAYVGRKRILTPCPIKELALAHQIPVFSPDKIRHDYEPIKELQPDIIITCAYGQIISQVILDIPRLGCINIHASLLPKYRGGAPIHHVLINGEKETGITLMYMDKGMDTGDIIKKATIPIAPDDQLDTLSHKLSVLGAQLMLENLPSIIDGTNERTRQNDEEATLAPLIKREHEHLDFAKTKEDLYNLLRALSPNPYPYFILDGLEYKVVEAKPIDGCGTPGTITEVGDDYLIIMGSNGGLKITKIKPFGKTIMLVRDYFNGIKKTTLIGKEVN